MEGFRPEDLCEMYKEWLRIVILFHETNTKYPESLLSAAVKFDTLVPNPYIKMFINGSNETPILEIIIEHSKNYMRALYQEIKIEELGQSIENIKRMASEMAEEFNSGEEGDN